MMILVGIDVAKDKHDCFIMTNDDFSKIKIGLEATGHYSYNILGYLLDKGLTTFVINPLHTNLYRKSLSLRKTKTDKVDSQTIATMLMSDVNLKSYSNTLYHNEELKSLTRYRFDKVQQRAKLKTSIARLMNILFPELETLVSSLHLTTVYALFSEFPSANAISNANLTKLSNLLISSSKGRFNKDTAILFRETARNSIGSNMPAKSLELKHTINSISQLTAQINEIETEIESIIKQIASPILSIPGIGMTTGAMIIAEIRNFSTFCSPDKILAFAGLHLQLTNQVNFTHHMQKWRKVVLNIFAMLYLTLQNSSATGIKPLVTTFLKNVPKVNTTMLPFFMLLKNLLELFTIWRKTMRFTFHLNSFTF